MAWFLVEATESGAVLNYKIVNHLVEVRNPEHLKALRAEPNLFKELNQREVARHKATSRSSNSEEQESVEEKEVEEITENENPEKVEEPEGENLAAKETSEKTVVKKVKKKKKGK